jgi:hypothetical protein
MLTIVYNKCASSIQNELITKLILILLELNLNLLHEMKVKANFVHKFSDTKRSVLMGAKLVTFLPSAPLGGMCLASALTSFIPACLMGTARTPRLV